MSISQIQVGHLYDWGGYVVEAREILPNSAILIECPEIGEDVVSARSLKSLEPETYETVPFDYYGM